MNDLWFSWYFHFTTFVPLHTIVHHHCSSAIASMLGHAQRTLQYLPSLMHASSCTSTLQAALFTSLLVRPYSSVLSDDGTSRIQLGATDTEVEELIESNLVRQRALGASMMMVCILIHHPLLLFPIGQDLSQKGGHIPTASYHHQEGGALSVCGGLSLWCLYSCKYIWYTHPMHIHTSTSTQVS